MSEAAALLRRYLDQRRELGEHEIFLHELTPADLEALLAARASKAPSRDPDAPSAAVRPAAAEAAAAARHAGARTASPPEPRTQREVIAGAPAAGVTAAELVRLGSLGALRDEALGCPRCRLAETRTHVVFGEGNPQAELLVVGEAPGADEDSTGRPFVGRAGKLLDLLLASVGFEREQVYICNVLKCRPPANRNPQPDEVHACSPYLQRQIELIGPKVILACGTFAAQTLLQTQTSIGKLRAQRHTVGGVRLIATYHPAALLRNRAWIRPVWEDLQKLRASLDSG